MNYFLMALVVTYATADIRYPPRTAGISEYAIGRVIVLGGSVNPSPPEPAPQPRPKPQPKPEPTPKPEPKPDPKPVPSVCPDCKNTGKIRSPEGFIIGDCNNPNCPVKKGEVGFIWDPKDPDTVVVLGKRMKRLPPNTEEVKKYLDQPHQGSKWTSKTRYQICFGTYCRFWFLPDNLEDLNLVSSKYSAPEKKQ